jgi:SAM-dependent methyltransferase
VRESFLRETLILGDWYRHLVDIMVSAFPAAHTFLDFGCNMGHFGFDLTARGKQCTGVDVPRNETGKRFLEQIIGIDFEFISAQYSEELHRIPDFVVGRQFDVGVFSVVIMHLTDPHYALRYFSKKLRHGMFFSSLLVPGNVHHFLARMTPYNRDKELPHAFELVPSEPLAESMLRLSGFGHVYKIPYREGVDPRHRSRWGCWLAAREPIAEEAISRFGLMYVEDQIDRYADNAPRPLIAW